MPSKGADFKNINLLLDRPISISLILVFLILLSSYIEFSVGQDIDSYTNNIIDTHLERGGKTLFYNFFALPLYAYFGSVDFVLSIIKSTIITIFFIALTLNARNIKHVLVGSLVILLMPTFQEHFQEFLRQGLSLALLFCGLSLKKFLPKVFLVCLSIGMHYIVLIPLSFIFFYSAIIYLLGRSITFPLMISMVITSLILPLMFYTPYDIRGLLQDIPYVLSGQRANILGLTFIFFYMIIMAYQFSRIPTAYMFAAFATACMVLALYPIITDFSRFICIVSVCHFCALAFSVSTRPIAIRHFIFVAGILAIIPTAL